MYGEGRLALSGICNSMRIRSKSAGTDTISSIALVACCIISSMVFISSLSYSFGERTALRLQVLRQDGAAIFQELIGSMTEIGNDGVRYLRNDWAAIVHAFATEHGSDCRVSCLATVRILHQPDYILSIAGNPSRCTLTERFAVAALLLTGHSSLPAEISMVVGI